MPSHEQHEPVPVVWTALIQLSRTTITHDNNMPVELTNSLCRLRNNHNFKLRGGKDKHVVNRCCCCLNIKSLSGLYSVLSNIRTGPTDANAFRRHRLTTQKGYTYQKEIKGPRKVNTHAIIGK